jgi:hypothetical protein
MENSGGERRFNDYTVKRQIGADEYGEGALKSVNSKK